jgi:ATP-dependent Clp protease adaptor protein ClpS
LFLRGNFAAFTVMSSAVVLPEVEEEIGASKKTRDDTDRLYHVILLNDDDHTYDYVVEMLVEIFGFEESKAYEHTVEVDTKGHSRLGAYPLPEAEKKRDQIHAYGADFRLPRSAGSMAALIEPAG